MKKYEVHQQLTLNADPMTVWDALTNPEKTKKYFFGCRVFSDWKPGSPITFKGRMFWIIPIKIRGKIIEAKPGKVLKYELHNKAGSTSIVTDRLTTENGKTTLSIHDDVGMGEGAEKRYHRSVKGWHKILAGLKEFLKE